VPEATDPGAAAPALPNLNRGEAILAGAATTTPAPSPCCRKTETTCKVAECMPHRSLIETSSVEVFEFIRNQAAS
jgi:hypothetical protein